MTANVVVATSGKEAVMKEPLTVVDHDLEVKGIDELLGLDVLSCLLVECDFYDLNTVSIRFNSGRDLTGRGLTGVSPPVEPFKVEDLASELFEIEWRLIAKTLQVELVDFE